ncbi:MAG: PDGLE domain-containing protein [Anaerolineae bacterium]|nr:PDGLE domain-containing protein [Anaerolineae bacterium]
MKGINKLWIGLGILALLSPLGLLASGTAWGEWGADEFSSMLGYVPQGLAKFAEIWNAPLPDYTIPGLGDVPGYILSAIVGMALVVAFTWGLGRLLARRES